MKKFTKYLKESVEAESILERMIETFGTPEDAISKYLNDDVDETIVEYIDVNMERYKPEIVETYKSSVKALLQDMLNGFANDIVSENLETDEVYKSDEQIEDTYSDYKLEEFNFEQRDMSYMYDNKVYEATAVWTFNEEADDEEQLTEGGYNQSVEDVMYATEANEDGEYVYKYAINNWYPENVYDKMCDIIEEKLKEKYGHDYERGSLDHKD